MQMIIKSGLIIIEKVDLPLNCYRNQIIYAEAMQWPNFPKVPGSIPLTALLICSMHLHVQVELMGSALGIHGFPVVLSWGSWVRPSSWVPLDLPFLTPQSSAGCGRLQLEATYWATSVAFNCNQFD